MLRLFGVRSVRIGGGGAGDVGLGLFGWDWFFGSVVADLGVGKFPSGYCQPPRGQSFSVG